MKRFFTILAVFAMSLCLAAPGLAKGPKGGGGGGPKGNNGNHYGWYKNGGPANAFRGYSYNYGPSYYPYAPNYYGGYYAPYSYSPWGGYYGPYNAGYAWGDGWYGW